MKLNELAEMMSGFDRGRSFDGDSGASFPRSDAADIRIGARFIPGEVTMARRRGDRVVFVAGCGMNCWHWRMPNGDLIYHFDPSTFAAIAQANGKTQTTDSDGRARVTDGAGPCPSCGNVNTNGGTVKASVDHKRAPLNTAAGNPLANLGNALMLGNAGAIEAQEATGQSDLVNSDTWPVTPVIGPPLGLQTWDATSAGGWVSDGPLT